MGLIRWWLRRHGQVIVPAYSAKMLREAANIIETAPYQRNTTASWLRYVARKMP